MFPMSVTASSPVDRTQRWQLAQVTDPKLVPAWPHRLGAARHAIWFYLSKLLLPHPLITIYPRRHITGGGPWGSYLALLGIERSRRGKNQSKGNSDY